MSEKETEQPAMRWDMETVRRWYEESMLLPASVLTKDNFIDHTATEAAIMRRHVDMWLEQMKEAMR